jgi:hypothetical protein
MYTHSHITLGPQALHGKTKGSSTQKHSLIYDGTRARTTFRAFLKPANPQSSVTIPFSACCLWVCAIEKISEPMLGLAQSRVAVCICRKHPVWNSGKTASLHLNVAPNDNAGTEKTGCRAALN